MIRLPEQYNHSNNCKFKCNILYHIFGLLKFTYFYLFSQFLSMGYRLYKNNLAMFLK